MTLEEAERLHDEEMLKYTRIYTEKLAAERELIKVQNEVAEAQRDAKIAEMRFMAARRAYLELKLASPKLVVTP